MKTAHDIILKPVITENSMAGIADKKYTLSIIHIGRCRRCAECRSRESVNQEKKNEV